MPSSASPQQSACYQLLQIETSGESEGDTQSRRKPLNVTPIPLCPFRSFAACATSCSAIRTPEVRNHRLSMSFLSVYARCDIHTSRDTRERPRGELVAADAWQRRSLPEAGEFRVVSEGYVLRRAKLRRVVALCAACVRDKRLCCMRGGARRT